MNIIYLLIGAAAGFAAAWFIAKSKFIGLKGLSIDESDQLKKELVDLNSELRIKEDRFNMLHENILELKNKLNDKESQLLIHQKNLVAKESDLRHLTERLTENKKEVDELQAKFRIEFENLANKILEEKTGKFTEQNKKNLDEILNPLKDRIQQFERRVEETHKKDIEDRASIQERIKNLVETSNQISEDAKNLTRALKGDSKAQGNWGELILENILEKSGLVKDREYFVQQSFKDDAGSRFQPDVVIKFPDNRNIIIDSKVSLTAYERFVAAESHEQQEKALSDHIISVKNHIKELSEKKYQDLVDINSLDFVMMFLPIEPAFLIAIQREQELWNFAYKKGIILISPTNLIAVLKMVSNFWEQDRQNKNVLEIARQSGALYDKFLGFVNDLQDIEKKIDGAKQAHQNAMKKLSTGKDNLVGKVERIKKLGAKTEKELPEDLFED
ncbi:MAG: DNA recombination protein RmuC [Marinilabiliales bacterium]|nr:MAG: DNA recombination protein RmuC [Marinilabiliales bacterium]